MSAASRLEVSGWLQYGKSVGASHVIIVCDTYDWSDYPVFVGSEEDVHEIYKSYTGKEMQRVEEVYDLSISIESQLAEKRAMHL